MSGRLVTEIIWLHLPRNILDIFQDIVQPFNGKATHFGG